MNPAPPLDNVSAALSRARSMMSARIECGELAGAVTAIAALNGAEQFACVGYAERDAGMPMTPDTIVRVYSMTKPITALATLLLCDDGACTLDTELAELIPAFGAMQIASGDDAAAPLLRAQTPITLRHLLTHTAGLCYANPHGSRVERLMAAAVGGGHGEDSEAGATLASWTARLAHAPLAHEPGRGWTYGVAMDVLARVVEVVSGMTFDAFLRARVFTPLGMHDTDFFVPADKRARVATVYQRKSASSAIARVDWPGMQLEQRSTFLSGGGGLFSTARDYLRFCRLLLNGGTLDGCRLLGSETVASLCSHQLQAFALRPETLDVATLGAGCDYGLGVRVVSDATSAYGDRDSYGWDGLAGTTFLVDPSRGLTAVFLTQITPWPSGLHESWRRAVFA